MRKRIFFIVLAIVMIISTTCNTFAEEINYADRIATERYAIMIVLNDGSLWGWGSILPLSSEDGDYWETVMPPTKVLDNVKKVVLGEALGSAGGAISNYFLAIKNDNSLWACGENEYGVLGLPDSVKAYQPKKVIDNVKDVIAIYRTSFILKQDGTILENGADLHGSMSGDNTDYAVTMKKIPNDGMYSEIFNVKNRNKKDYKQAGPYMIKPDGSLWRGDKKEIILNNFESRYEYDESSLQLCMNGKKFKEVHGEDSDYLYYLLAEDGSLYYATKDSDLNLCLKNVLHYEPSNVTPDIVIKKDGSVWTWAKEITAQDFYPETNNFKGIIGTGDDAEYNGLYQVFPANSFCKAQQ